MPKNTETGLPCDDCVHDVQGCCNYDEPLGRACVLGSAYKQKPLEQLSIFDFLEEKPVHRYRATFKNIYGIVMHVFFEVNDKKDIRETLQKYRQEHKDQYFQFIEEI